jgi:hypothetical protein
MQPGTETEEDVALFGGDVPPDARRLIEAARSAREEDPAKFLWSALVAHPDCLPVYYILYKLHAGRREFDLAERAALAALAQAGHQAGLHMDWRTADLPLHARGDLKGDGAARFWLFTLKALAFISLRSGREQDARRLLALIAAHDPSRSVGSDVTEALLAGSAEPRS